MLLRGVVSCSAPVSARRALDHGKKRKKSASSARVAPAFVVPTRKTGFARRAVGERGSRAGIHEKSRCSSRSNELGLICKSGCTGLHAFPGLICRCLASLWGITIPLSNFRRDYRRAADLYGTADTFSNVPPELYTIFEEFDRNHHEISCSRETNGGQIRKRREISIGQRGIEFLPNRRFQSGSAGRKK